MRGFLVPAATASLSVVGGVFFFAFLLFFVLLAARAAAATTAGSLHAGRLKNGAEAAFASASAAVERRNTAKYLEPLLRATFLPSSVDSVTALHTASPT